MPAIKQIEKEISSIETIRALSGALLEVSAHRIQSLRSDFEHNQRFFDEITELYNIVKVSSLRSHTDRGNPKPKSMKKTMSVAVTSNKGFYGLLNTRVIEHFLEDIKRRKTDCVVIGQIGKRFFEQTDYQEQCQYLTFKNDYPTQGETQVFLQKVKEYDQVFLFYPKFVSIFTQDVGIVDITYTPDQEVNPNKKLEHIFEPELSKIVHFFETQVRKLLFMRIMLESELARVSARLMKMSSTEQRAEDMIVDKERELHKEVEILNDIQLLESFSSLKKWVTK